MTRFLNWRDQKAYRHHKATGRRRLAYELNARKQVTLEVQYYGSGWQYQRVAKRQAGKRLRALIRSGRVRSLAVIGQLSPLGKATFVH